MPAPQGLGKPEILRSPEAISALFRKGSRIRQGGLILVYGPVDTPEITTLGMKVAFAVPKRTHKLAVHRNRLKRLMREAYRKNRARLNPPAGESLGLLFIYQGRGLCTYSQMEADLSRLLERLNERL